MSQYRGIKKVNLSQCMLDESKRWGLNSKKKSLYITSSNPVLEWESSIHVPKIHLVQEIHFGIWDRLDIMIISFSVQVYSFSTKGEGLNTISHLIPARFQTLILWHGSHIFSLLLPSSARMSCLALGIWVWWLSCMNPGSLRYVVCFCLKALPCLLTLTLPKPTLEELKSSLVNLINFG